MRLLNRREFNALGAAVCSTAAVNATIASLSGTSVRAEATGAISDPLGQTVKFKDGPSGLCASGTGQTSESR
jgi:hypothetical protein